jgi:hypothetical protein
MENMEHKLSSFDPAQRRQALRRLWEGMQAGQVTPAPHCSAINLHCHTFFSYNSYGYSPCEYAWRAYKAGLEVVGIVDFDVLDGLDEFLTAAALLNLKACVGMETRVYVPEFADKEITSPGEPGITYHMGMGFPQARLSGDAGQFLANLRQTAQQRNIKLMNRVNDYLQPVELDYENDVLPLTPAGNATERHICLAYARKARSVFPDDRKLVDFWSGKLGDSVQKMDMPESRDLLNLLRTKTMKRGGSGYVQPDKGSFPRMDQMNEFVLAAGAIPTLTWLDGTSPGEQEIEKLLEIAMSSGVGAINIVPDRNYTPGVKDEKAENLFYVVELAQKLHLPVVVGTEMNSPGQKFVDDFASRELSRLLPVFLKGAHIVYAHSILQRQGQLGYTSEWAINHFPDTAAKNDFYEKIGKTVQPTHEKYLGKFDQNSTPTKILDELQRVAK